jgi:hypothetical protein
MGFYINPVDGNSKEYWLNHYGSPISQINELKDYKFDGKFFPVCLVDNGMFTAAGIAYDKRELEVFSNPEDTRPKQWFEVNLDFIIDPERGALTGEELENFLKIIKKG